MSLTLPQQNRISCLVAENGWREGLNSFVREAPNRSIEALLNELRRRHSAWTGLLDLRGVEVAHVIDFSLGASAISLSRLMPRVVTYYQHECTRRIISERIDFLGIDNVEFKPVDEIFAGLSFAASDLFVVYEDGLDQKLRDRLRHFCGIAANSKYILLKQQSLRETLIGFASSTTTYYIDGETRDPFNYQSDESKKSDFGLLKYLLLVLIASFTRRAVAVLNTPPESSYYSAEIDRILPATTAYSCLTFGKIFFVKPYGVLIELRGSEQRLLARIALDENAENKFRNSVQILNSLKALDNPLLPSIVAQGRGNDNYICIEQALVGKNILPGRLQASGPRQRIYRQAFELLTEIQQFNAETVTMEGRYYNELVAATVNDVAGFFGSDLSDAFDRIGCFLESRFENRKLPVVINHGDFTVDNLMFDGDRVTGLIDWEHARSRGLPLVDLLMFITSVNKKIRGASIWKRLISVVLLNRYSPFEKELVTEYCQLFDIPYDLLPAFAAVTGLEYLRYRHHFSDELSENSVFIQVYSELVRAIDNLAQANS